ncbi:MAG: S8/S53 family peptidase [Thermoplasmatota archaeon]
MATVLTAATLAGCLTPGTNPERSLNAKSGESERPVVIGLVDTGINPYHIGFRDSRADKASASVFVDGSNGRPPVEVQLSLNARNYTIANESDRALWAGLRPGVLYHFAGTRVLAITFDPASVESPPILDIAPHGTNTAGIALAHDPSAWIVMIQAYPKYTFGMPLNYTTDGHLLNPDLALAMTWAAKQSWIDVVSLSFGMRADAPTPTELAFARASREAAGVGKLIFGAVDNGPSLALTDTYGDAPWEITVTGANNTAHGRALLSGDAAEFSAEYANLVPEAFSMNETEISYGTSLATPLVAGEVARALSYARDHGLNVTSHQVRDALNASARLWNTTDWQPAAPNPTIESLTLDPTLPVAPLVPAASMGWGYVDKSVGDEIIHRLMTNETALPAEKQGANADFMAAAYAARQAYWNAVLGN